MAELVLALDFPDAREALAAARPLAGIVPWMKVGLELFTASGPRVLGELKGMGFKTFLDLKLFDIPNTVRSAVRAAALAGADMLTLHALGGSRMAQAAREGRDQGPSGQSGPLLLAVTVLTSMEASDLPFPAPKGVAGLVRDLAGRAKADYLDGVVCSGLECPQIKAECGSAFLCLTPGIRPAAAGDDQRRTVTPVQAVEAGADFLVVGRPITKAADPARAARDVLAQMAGGTTQS